MSVSNPLISLETTLCYIIVDRRVLLIKKKRGFGQGKWNGIGGKLQAGEDPLIAAQREVLEEVGLVVSEMMPRGFIEFYWPAAKAHFNNRCYIFSTTKYSGVPTESAECIFQWFDTHALPFEEMWPDDRLWYPDLFAGHEIKKRYYFSHANELVRGEEI